MKRNFLPKENLYIMLNPVIRVRNLFCICSTLLLFISFITFHTNVSADIMEQTAENYRALGYEEQQKGNINEALAYYTKAATLGAENPVLFNDMGVLYEGIDLNSRAEQYYLKSIQSDAKYLPAYINLAYLYQRLGRTEQAAWYFKKRYELGNPTDPWAQKAKDELLMIKPEYQEWIQSREAVSLNNQLVAKSRDEFFQRVQRGQEHYKKGESFFEEGKYKEAMKEYDAALNFTPKNPKFTNARKKAILEIAKESIKENSEQAIKRLELGDTLSARHEIQKILTTIPEEPMLTSW